MLTHPQHIKCLEAVMLALHLTNSAPFSSLDRVPVGFKTTETAMGHEYRYSAWHSHHSVCVQSCIRVCIVFQMALKQSLA